MQQIKKPFKDIQRFQEENSLRDESNKFLIPLLLINWKFNFYLTYKRWFKATDYQNMAFVFLR